MKMQKMMNISAKVYNRKSSGPRNTTIEKLETENFLSRTLQKSKQRFDELILSIKRPHLQ